MLANVSAVLALHPDKSRHSARRRPLVHEVKHDGYRLIARRVDDRVVLRMQGGFNWADRYPRILRSVLALRTNSIVLDGEVACVNKYGISDFDALHSGRNDERAGLLVFDVLEIDGIGCATCRCWSASDGCKSC